MGPLLHILLTAASCLLLRIRVYSHSGYPITIGPYYGIYRQVTTRTTISFPPPVLMVSSSLQASHESRMQLSIWCSAFYFRQDDLGSLFTRFGH